MLAKQVLRQFSTKAKPTPNNLSNYDIVIVGAHIGGILSRQLETLLQQRFNVFVVYDNQYNQCNHLDMAFQQGYLNFENYYLDVAKTLSPQTPHSDGVGIDKYLPDENAIILTNGRRISYKQLVVSAGLQQDVDQIKGLKDALEDNGHPVFGPYIDSRMKVDTAKKPEHYFKFTGGKSFFYIPPFPVQGEGSHYNFFAAFDVWRENQKKYLKKTVFDNLDIEFQVINANSTFSQHSSGLNEFIIQELNNRGIKYTLNTQVQEVHKNDRKLTLVDESGEKQNIEYDNFYTIMPTRQHQNLVEAKLASEESNLLLDVDQKTLQHKKYKNIFGLGDVCNIPTTKSFIAGQQQANVVRNNVFRNITGQYLNAFYDGFSKVPIYISNDKLTWFSHYYENRKGPLSLLGSNGGWISKLRYYGYSLVNPFWNSLYYTGKVYGPPYQFWMNSYKEMEKIPAEQLQNQQIHNQSLYEQFQAVRRDAVQVAVSGYNQSQQQQQQQQQQTPKTQQKNSEKYTKIESPTAPPKRKRGRPKKNPGDVTDYTSE